MQEAICSSLEDYNKQIETLKEEMNDTTHGADNIRNDISALAQRCTVIDRDEECGVLIFHSSRYTFDKVAISLFILLLVVVYHNYVKINLLSIVRCTVFTCSYESVVEMVVNLTP